METRLEDVSRKELFEVENITQMEFWEIKLSKERSKNNNSGNNVNKEVDVYFLLMVTKVVTN